MYLEEIAENVQLENDKFECKSVLNREDVVGWLKSIAGFANATGGDFYIGVEDKTNKLIGLIIPEQFADDYVQIIESLVKNGFSKSSLNLRRGYFNISLEEIDEDDIEYFENTVFSYQTENDSEKVVAIKSRADELGNQILSFIESKYVIPFLSSVGEKAGKSVERKETQSTRTEALSFTISIPEKMDKGKSAQIVVIGASKAQALGQIQCEIDNPDIVSYADGKITALRVGQTSVKFKIIGKLEYISKHQITVIEHILVNRIELNQTSFDGLLNDSFKIVATCYPETAENIAELLKEVGMTPVQIIADICNQIK
nr:ATP-binding protein [uncultured Blautia sp.]